MKFKKLVVAGVAAASVLGLAASSAAAKLGRCHTIYERLTNGRELAVEFTCPATLPLKSNAGVQERCADGSVLHSLPKARSAGSHFDRPSEHHPAAKHMCVGRARRQARCRDGPEYVGMCGRATRCGLRWTSDAVLASAHKSAARHLREGSGIAFSLAGCRCAGGRPLRLQPLAVQLHAAHGTGGAYGPAVAI
jgi:hypothetical protein